MKQHIVLCGIILMCCFLSRAADNLPPKKIRDNSSGTLSLGTRNTASLFTEDVAAGLGIGGQFRLQVNDRINTEWFADYITAKSGNVVVRNDYHIGWSVMFYPGAMTQFTRFLQPYLLAGHCFDYTKVFSTMDSNNFADRLSMATQAGAGTHLNFNSRFDCSISAQYMLHFGKEIQTITSSDAVQFQMDDHSSPHGHLLTTVSFNYKFADLWR